MASDEDLVLRMINLVTEYRDELHAPDGRLAGILNALKDTRGALDVHLAAERDNWALVKHELAQTRALVERIWTAVERIDARVDTLEARIARLEARVARLES